MLSLRASRLRKRGNIDADYKVPVGRRYLFGGCLLVTTTGITKMFILQIAALGMLAAGTLIALLTTEFGPDVALIVLAAFT